MQTRHIVSTTEEVHGRWGTSSVQVREAVQTRYTINAVEEVQCKRGISSVQMRKCMEMRQIFHQTMKSPYLLTDVSTWVNSKPKALRIAGKMKRGQTVKFELNISSWLAIRFKWMVTVFTNALPWSYSYRQGRGRGVFSTSSPVNGSF